MEPTIYKPSIYKGAGGIYKCAGGIYNGRGVYNDMAESVGGSRFYRYIDEIPGHSSFPRFTINGEYWSFLSGGSKSELLTRSELDIPQNTNKIKISFDKYIPSFSSGAQSLLVKLKDGSLYFYPFRNHFLWNTTKNKNIVFFANSGVSLYIEPPSVYNGGENYTLNANEYITLGVKPIFNTAVKNQYIIEKDKLTCLEDDIKIFEATKNDDDTSLKEIDMNIEVSTNGYYLKNLYIEWE